MADQNPETLKRTREDEDAAAAEAETAAKKSKVEGQNAVPESTAVPLTTLAANAAKEAVQAAKELTGSATAEKESAAPVKVEVEADKEAGGDAAMAEAEPAAAEQDEARALVKTEDGDAAMVESPDGKAATALVGTDPPVTLCYKTFPDVLSCKHYYGRLLSQLTPNQDLNEYEHNMVLELLKKGHPEPLRKIESGIKAIQVQVAAGFDFDTKCFVLFRTNGTSDDFSVRKCLAKLFPATYQAFIGDKEKDRGGKGGGGRSPGGRGGRSPGGRGGRRGGGNFGRRGGRGGRGRGRRGRG